MLRGYHGALDGIAELGQGAAVPRMRLLGDRGPLPRPKPARPLSPSLRSSTLTHKTPKEQSRNTPRYLVDAIEAVLGRRLELDPCSNALAIVNPLVEVRFGGELDVVPVPLYATEAAAIAAEKRVVLVGDGLTLDWCLYRDAFFNPPWESLGDWLAKAVRSYASAIETLCEGRAGARGWELEHVFGLVPLRSHRRYWSWAWTASAIAFLPPVAYEDFDGDTLPTPCVMLYWGPDVKRFKTVFEAIESTVLTRLPGQSNLTRMAQKKPTRAAAKRQSKPKPEFKPVETRWRRADGSWTEDGEHRFMAELALHLANALPVETVANCLLEIARADDWKQKQDLSEKLNRGKRWDAQIQVPRQPMATLADLNELHGRGGGYMRESKVDLAVSLILERAALPQNLKIEAPKPAASPAKKAAATKKRRSAAKKAVATKAAKKKQTGSKKAGKQKSAKGTFALPKARKGDPKHVTKAARDKAAKAAKAAAVPLRDHVRHMKKVIDKAGEAIGLAKRPPQRVQPELPGTQAGAGDPAPSKNGAVKKGDRAALAAAVISTILKPRGDKPVQVNEIAEAMHVSKPTALRVMKELVAAKTVEKVGAGRSAAYKYTGAAG